MPRKEVNIEDELSKLKSQLGDHLTDHQDPVHQEVDPACPKLDKVVKVIGIIALGVFIADKIIHWLMM